ncbi:hypothetical protein [Bacillus subtilis]|uniref:hypothetical protein n=1 Tax=Bacillus subtilis TaxID=1423 RepID=UPI00102E7327|nr:hypothetical protein [Bacillus subtilis]MEC1539541.1 hypothetical protein [Bacillus subtilis]NTU15500.1 hypothetical protein [Bacillus subtilis subsp. subtilis]TAH81174.1 hypothetical protein ES060_15350 [Bacillus subtilis]TAH88759.1 hypothetical protein ES066_07085 [Bacillus subtilis]WFA92044.1 hypothetical protein LFL98_20490 [Bacillus subtilis]
MSTETLQKFLEKVTAKKILDNINSVLSREDIKQKQLSIRTGKSDNAFNKMLNEMKSPKLTTILRYLESVNEILRERKREEITLEQIIDDEALEIIKVTNNIADADLTVFLSDNKGLLKSTIYYFELLKKKKKISAEEEKIYKEIKGL